MHHLTPSDLVLLAERKLEGNKQKMLELRMYIDYRQKHQEEPINWRRTMNLRNLLYLHRSGQKPLLPTSVWYI
jgi:hypothetical protein